MKKSKVRFAPSPTGPLHIGGARSALFNYLLAQHDKGDFLVRIEDTDLERSKREYEGEILSSLKWLGLTWNEGIEVGGDNGPYRQTERLDIYQKYAEELLASGKAYYCFCSDEELEQERQEALAKGELVRYSGKCRSLTAAQIQEKLDAGEKPGIRLRVPAHQILVVNDKVRGKVNFDTETMGDFIIVKSDNIPTYNFAVVIDDVLMGVTHVIRAEEHLSNTPRQLLIYDALNLPRPEFAHISLILGSDRQKMSKRHGATSLMQYREMGYLPVALFNFLALLGWSPQGEKEIMTPEEIIQEFTLERVVKSPAVFDLDKLNYINQQHIKRLELEELKNMLRPYLEQGPFKENMAIITEAKFNILVEALRDRLICLTDINNHAEVFFMPAKIEEEAREVLQGEGVLDMLNMFKDKLEDFNSPEEIKKFIKTFIKEQNLKPKNVYMPLRCALTGQTHGPELPYLIFFWGQAETRQRLEKVIGTLV
jgi:nondiscriminating glutamyl-tRNA synthetase